MIWTLCTAAALAVGCGNAPEGTSSSATSKPATSTAKASAPAASQQPDVTVSAKWKDGVTDANRGDKTGKVRLQGTVPAANGTVLFLYETEGRNLTLMDSTRVQNQAFDFGQVEVHRGFYQLATDNAKNNWDPLYTFSTEDVATRVNEVTVLEEMLEEISVVPNPYYAYSQYETNKLDNRVKIVNLPEVCTVRIYNLSGTLIRTYDKADPLTYVDWDLKNEANVPIAGGVYIIHVDVPGVGQAIRKWFGVMRPVDLDNF